MWDIVVSPKKNIREICNIIMIQGNKTKYSLNIELKLNYSFSKSNWNVGH